MESDGESSERENARGKWRQEAVGGRGRKASDDEMSTRERERDVEGERKRIDRSHEERAPTYTQRG